jgi:hypothetical protein
VGAPSSFVGRFSRDLLAESGYPALTIGGVAA